MKGGRRHKIPSRAFTLIELLVVLGVIAILVAILVPTVQTVFKKGNKTSAQGDVSRIVTAWKNYYAEYGHWPANAVEDANSTNRFMNATRVVTLTMRVYEETADNPKGLKFIEVGADEIDSYTNMVDPWGTPYRVLFDTNFDGHVSSTLYPDVYDTVMAWSPGPDTDDVTKADNVTSWQ